MGIQAVMAESVSRLFLRNSINAGFPVIACLGVTSLVEEGDEIEMDLRAGTVRRTEALDGLRFPPLPDDSPAMQILSAGGLIPYMKRRLGLDRG